MGDSTHFECPICLSEALDPRCLKCGHLLCFDCLSQQSQDGSFACSLCKTAHDRTPEETPKVHAIAAYLVDLYPAFRVEAVTCQIHDKQVEFHCKSCDVQCCSICFMMNHDGHPMESFIKQRFSQFQKIVSSIDIQSVLEDLQKEELQLTNNVRQMTEKLAKLRLKMNQVEICKAKYEEFLKIKRDITHYQETTAVIALHDLSSFIATYVSYPEFHSHPQDMNFDVPYKNTKETVHKTSSNIGTVTDVGETVVCHRSAIPLVQESSAACSITNPVASKMGIVRLRAKHARLNGKGDAVVRSANICIGNQMSFHLKLKIQRKNQEHLMYYIGYEGAKPKAYIRYIIILHNFGDTESFGQRGEKDKMDHARECFVQRSNGWGSSLVAVSEIRREDSPWADRDGSIFVECIIELLN